jgi:hypothetical protein
MLSENCTTRPIRLLDAMTRTNAHAFDCNRCRD